MADVIPLFRVFMAPEVDKAVLATLHSGYVTQGPKVDQLEVALTPWMGRRPLTTNSGTSALQLALRLADVGTNDEVITTPMTCIATNVTIRAAGAIPVWADVDPDTGLIDPQSVHHRITTRTKAIMAVDWGGVPCDYDALMAIGHEYQLKVIADAAHSLGATYKGHPVGSIADFTAFSFQAIKHLTTVDGGALTCRAPADYERGRKLRWYGVDRTTNLKFRGEADVEEWGYKFHMNDVAASIGLANLTHLEEVLDLHRDHSDVLHSALHGPLDRVIPSYAFESSEWVYTLLCENAEVRDQFQEHLRVNGIESSQVHWRNDRHTTFAEFQTDLPGVDAFSERMLCLPTHWGADASRIAAAMASFGT